MWEAVGLGFAANGAFFVFGLLVQRVFHRFRLRLPERFWARVAGGGDVLVVLSARESSFPTNPYVPLLEVRGLDVVSRQLAAIRKTLAVDSGRTLASADAQGRGMLILGSQTQNGEAARFLASTPAAPPWAVEATNDGLMLMGQNSSFHPSVEEEGGWRTTDHVMLMSGRSALDPTQKALLVAGTTAVATRAGAVALTDRSIQKQLLGEFGTDDFAVVVEVSLAKQQIVGVEIIASRRL